MIHEDFWSPIDFLSGNVDSFCIVFLAFKLLLHPHSVSSIVLSRYGVFLWLKIEAPGYWRKKRAVIPE